MPALFDIPERASKSDDKALIQKSKKKSTSKITSKGNYDISMICATVEKYLGKYADEMETVQDGQVLSDYIDKAIDFGYIAIDTETTGLDPLKDDLVGIGLYLPNEKAIYIPVGHISHVTGALVKNQLSTDVVGRILRRLEDAGTKNIFFNAVFDIRFIKKHCGVRLSCYWDCYLASRCLNENEPNKGLKKLHQKYILKGEEDAFKFDELFKGKNFALIPLKTAYLYAAHDPKITWEYFDYQRQYLRLDHERKDMRDIAWVFFNIEMPCIDAVVDMEDTGIAFDMEYNEKLKEKYHAMLDERVAEFNKACKAYSKEISEYTGKTVLEDPININSVPQLQALLYDIIGLEGPIDKKTKQPSRSTGEEVLKKLKHPIVDAILSYRELSTIVSTFIDKLPECVNPNDGRIHCKFNQYGADTGRFSSQDPNMQNIPSHNKDIRKMFKATDGYVIMSADFSQQEVKGMAQMCHDEGMIEAFKKGADFYAQIASVAFNLPYNECLEHFPKGSYIKQYNGKWHYGTESDYDKIADGEKDVYADGKERRSQAKSILLGINYGRGAVSIAEQLGCSKQKAEKIKEDVFRGFPAIEEFERQSIEMAETKGYVTTLWGRKRRLPAMTLPDYSFEWKNGSATSDDPLDFSDDIDDEVPDELIDKWMRRLNNAWGNKKNHVIAQAEIEDGLLITDNTKKRSDATRQVVNSRIQGTAADQSKLAMIALQRDARLKELGFRMLIPIHDEILAECPVENVKECSERFAYLMSNSSGDRFEIPISCDVEISYRWFGKHLEIMEDGSLKEEE